MHKSKKHQPQMCECNIKECPLMQVDLCCGNQPREDLFQRLADESPYIMHNQDFLLINPQKNQTEHTFSVGCKCSKIGCLKLYCQCFARGIMCGKQCTCMGCENCKGNQKRILLAQQMANFRKPGSFAGVQSFVPLKKCTCKKSHCQKKYCQCHSAGIRCGPSCECIDCYNRQDVDQKGNDYWMGITVKG